jgi:hypothetical protein
MVKRVLLLSAFAIVALAPALILGALYQRERSVPYKSFYAPVCEPWINPPCASIDAIFVSGTALRVAGVILCLLAVLNGALLLLRLTRWWWLALASMVIATVCGAYALWLSQQALDDYRTVSLLPERFPPEFFERFLAHVQLLARTYIVWSVAAIALMAIALVIGMTLLWGATKARTQLLSVAPAM